MRQRRRIALMTAYTTENSTTDLKLAASYYPLISETDHQCFLSSQLKMLGDKVYCLHGIEKMERSIPG